MFAAIGISLAVVFLAELGDKSQLMALAFAARYRAGLVIGAIATSTTLVHLLSVGLGHWLGGVLGSGWVTLVAGLAFIGFGAWTLRGDRIGDDAASRGPAGLGAFVAVASVFFLAELGDKTMLATVALATDHDAVGVWIGSTVGMVAADALAILVGAVLGRRLPQRAIALGAASAFFGFGGWLLAGAAGLPESTAIAIGAAVAGWALALSVVSSRNAPVRNAAPVG